MLMASSSVRLMVISTPRSGNTWLRYLLSAAYQIPMSATHDLTDEQLAQMPQSVVHQIHWTYSPAFAEKISQAGFRVVTIVRHPLDTLISILHFCWYDPNTVMWLLGQNGDESVIRGAMPRSTSFLNYVGSPRAKALLQVSRDWFEKPGVVAVKYEDLVADTFCTLRRVTQELVPVPDEQIQKAIEANRFELLQETSVHNHFWKGRPGLWRELLTVKEVEHLRPSVESHARQFGYHLDADPRLTAEQADAAWVRYVGQELIQTIQKQTRGHQKQLEIYNEQANQALQAAARAEARVRELEQLLARYESA